MATKEDKFWIQKAVNKKGHKGRLRRWAMKHRLLNQDGTIDLSHAKKFARREGDVHRLREINLAINLRRLRA
jgi:hypothetical protein